MKLSFMSLASGSSGNCYYLGTEEYGILIDAGISVRAIKKALKENNIPFESILALFITHDHADHIKAAGSLGEKYHIPVYATEKIHEGMNHNYCMNEKILSSRRLVEKEKPLHFRDFIITPFEVPHDGTDNVGYYIEYGTSAFAFATDLGHISDLVARYLRRANYLVLEANYDTEMLKQGNYPAHLKARILKPNGHLSNAETAEFLANNMSPELKYVFLCHLSRNNNHPELAFKTVEYRLLEQGIKVGKDLQLVILKRHHTSEFYTF